ncbi:MAG: methylated-DNA--[protein]-cysteine S-methyltransferase [Chloroflexota bacterium]
MINSLETKSVSRTIPENAVVLGLAGTSMGPFGAVFTTRGLACLTFPSDSLQGCESWIRAREPGARVIGGHPVLASLSAQLTAYFEGSLHQFSVPLDLRGTPFQLDVWRALRAVPYGEVRSYADIARLIGRPRAVRAAGMANGDNPVPIIVPCHRVIGSNRSLTGYGGGLDLKERLLRLEDVRLSMKTSNTLAQMGTGSSY